MRKFFAVAALISGSHAFAQQDTSTLDLVTVSATKFSTKTTETGKVVVTITRKELEKAGSRDLAQVLTEFGGVFINGFNSTPGKEKNIYIRGAKPEHTLIAIDGIPVYDPSGIGSNFDIRNLAIDNIERIEILKGSQSTLYGSDAVAGVINIITRKASDKKPLSVYGTAQYGSFETRRLQAGVTGKADAIDYNLGVSQHKSAGFSEAKQEGTVTAANAFDKDGFEQNNIEASLGFQAKTNLRFQPFFRLNKSKGSLDQDAFTDEADFTYSSRIIQTGIHNTIGIGSGSINLRYQYSHTKRNYLDDSVQSRNGFYIFNRAAYTGREHFVEAFGVYLVGPVKLTVGSDYREAATDYDAQLSDPFSGGPYKVQTGGDSINHQQVSGYAAVNYVGNGLSLEGGGRINNHSEYGSNFAYNLNASYVWSNFLKVFGNVSSGYKVPSLYQLFSEYGNRNLQPEKSFNHELGIQVFSEQTGSSFRVTLFQRKVKDVITFFFNPTTFQSAYINRDRQEDKGIELDAKATIANKLDLKVFYSYVDGVIRTKVGTKDTSYFNLLRRPKHSAHLSIGSQLTKGLYVSAQANYIGEREDVFFLNVPPYGSKAIILDDYVLLNLYAEYGFMGNRLKVFADLRNITDKTYSDIYGYNTAGFNVYGGVRFRF